MNQSINTDNKNSKEPQQKYRLGTVSIKILGGLNRFYGRLTSPSASVMAQNIQLFGPRGGRLPTKYWLPKLHKKTYKARFIANSSSCTTTELSKLLTSCLTAVKNHVIRYCEKVYERSGKNFFWSIKNSGELLIN